MVSPTRTRRFSLPGTMARHPIPSVTLTFICGLPKNTEVAGGVVTHGHDGGIDGFISSYRYMPEQDWGYVVLLNSAGSGEALENINRLAIEFLSKDYPKPYKPVVSMAQ